MMEARAQQAEDYARLSPRERSERLVVFNGLFWPHWNGLRWPHFWAV